MEEQQNVRLPIGTTEWNHSFYTGPQHFTLFNSYKLVRALRLLCRCWPPHESHMVVASSSYVSCPQVAHSAISPQVQMDHTRTFTSDLLSATLAEAATQLPFAAFLERCIFVHASHLWMPLRRLSHTAASGDVSTQLSFMESLSTLDALCPTCSRPVPSLLLDAAVQTPLYSVASHDASTQLPLTEFFIGCIFSNDPLDR